MQLTRKSDQLRVDYPLRSQRRVQPVRKCARPSEQRPSGIKNRAKRACQASRATVRSVCLATRFEVTPAATRPQWRATLRSRGPAARRDRADFAWIDFGTSLRVWRQHTVDRGQQSCRPGPLNARLLALPSEAAADASPNTSGSTDQIAASGRTMRIPWSFFSDDAAAGAPTNLITDWTHCPAVHDTLPEHSDATLGCTRFRTTRGDVSSLVLSGRGRTPAPGSR